MDPFWPANHLPPARAHVTLGIAGLVRRTRRTQPGFGDGRFNLPRSGVAA